MNLQIVVPPKPCIYYCPYCISRTRETHFDNVLDNDLKEYTERFNAILSREQNLVTAVITGTNDPTQSLDAVAKIVTILKDKRPDMTRELQTKCYERFDLEYPLPKEIIDVVAFSIDDFADLEKPYLIKNVINRYTIILTDAFNGKTLDDILMRIPKEVTQVTFKVLQVGGDETNTTNQVNHWIAKHRLAEKYLQSLKQEVERVGESKGLSIRIDETCLQAKDRYKVVREDGLLYTDWDAVVPEEDR